MKSNKKKVKVVVCTKMSRIDYGRMDGWMDSQINLWVDGHINGWIGGWIERWIDR